MIHEKLLPAYCYSLKPLRPEGIIIHYISAKNTHPEDPYNPHHCFEILRDYKFSYHYMVLREADAHTGSTWQMAPDDKQAWHAGKSLFRGMSNLNQNFFGVAFIGDGDNDFTYHQYSEGSFAVQRLMRLFQIETNWVKGHEQVSGPRVRTDFKGDPGPRFDWVLFGSLISPRGVI